MKNSLICNDIVWMKDPTQVTYVRVSRGIADDKNSPPRISEGILMGYEAKYHTLSPRKHEATYYYLTDDDLKQRTDKKGNFIGLLPKNAIITSDLLKNLSRPEIKYLKKRKKLKRVIRYKIYLKKQQQRIIATGNLYPDIFS